MASQTGTFEEVAQALVGMTFPAGKDDLAAFAHRSRSDDDLTQLIAQLPNRKYASMTEIQEALAEVTRTPASSHSLDGQMSERNIQDNTTSEHLEEISPVPADQLEAVHKNQRAVESALNPKGLPQSEHYGKHSGARPTEER